MTRFDRDFLTALRVKPEDVTESSDTSEVLHPLVRGWKETDELRAKVQRRDDVIIVLAASIVNIVACFLVAWHVGIIEVVR